MASLSNLRLSPRDQFPLMAQESVGRSAMQIVYAEHDCWVTDLHVKPHQAVSCGKVLCEILSALEGGDLLEGHVVAPDHGVVKPVKGSPLFPQALSSKSSVVIFIEKGMPLFVIEREAAGHHAGTIRGLTPRPTRVMWLRAQRAKRPRPRWLRALTRAAK